ncbi:MAG: FG-GAP repeat domain-containing protein [Vicinamibacterales bacterium]
MTCNSAGRLGIGGHVVAVCALLVASVASFPGVAFTAPPSLFRASVAYSGGGASTSAAVVADVNRDGKADLVVATASDLGGAEHSNALVAVLLGNGDGTFQTPVVYDSGGNGPSSLAVADLNGDGIPDIAAANFASGSATPVRTPPSASSSVVATAHSSRL